MYCMIFLALHGVWSKVVGGESVTIACLESSLFTF